MKKTKLLSFLMAIIFVLTSIAACQQNTPNIPDDSEPGNEDISPETPNDDEPEIPDPAPIDPVVPDEPVVPDDPVVDPEPEYIYPSEEILYLRENLPIMDGSTSLIPLEAGLRAKIFDISINEATNDVKHSTTYGSFERLLNKEVDIIFSTPLSDEQYDQAAQKEMDLELIPIAAEAFVFVINADNPVETLTQQQIKDIYSGKITNWKEVGGEDVEIVAFQRNQTSGSQNYMREFMGETALMDAPTDTVPASMGALMDAIAEYDNSQNAIGYSVYAYAADMYGLGDKMKFVKVDGVAPNKESMSDKSYPLTNYNYVVYDKNSVTESTERMVNWICSNEGQQAVADAGYIPANANIDRKYLELIGTGAEIPEDFTVPTEKYTASLSFTKTLPENCEEITEDTLMFLNLNETEPYKVMTGIKWEINGINDSDLQAKINAKISEMTEIADLRAEEMINYIIKLNETEATEYLWFFPYGRNSFPNMPKTPENMYYYVPFEVSARALNGYLCIAVELKYYDCTDIFEYNYYTETAFFDLYTGEELQLTDLFFKDVDIDSILNSYFTGFKFEVDSYIGPQQLKLLKDFTQFYANDGFAMSFDKFWFNYDNTILKDCVRFNIELPFCIMVAEEPRDMEGLFEENVYIEHELLLRSHTTYEAVEGTSTVFSVIPETGPFAEANKRINEAMRELVKTVPDKTDVMAAYAGAGLKYNKENRYLFSAEEYVGNFIIFNGATEGFDNIYAAESIIFDAKTGERLVVEDLLKEGWQDHATFQNNDALTDDQAAQVEQKIIPDGVYLYGVFLMRDGRVEFGFNRTGAYPILAFYMTVDAEYVEIGK